GAEDLSVVSAGPVGEVASLAEANEIRVVFTEPMVVLGKIPQPVTAPFFKITPAVKGEFRWSGTTTLIFTPDAKTPLPFGTQFTVTIDKSAKSVRGNTLDRPYSWSFTTPTIRLISTDFYRKGGKADGAVVISLRFNQPVTTDVITPNLKITTEPHELEEPFFPPGSGMTRLEKLEPQAIAAYEAKKTKARAAAASSGQPILAFVATDWDKERFPVAKDQIVLETKPGIAPDTWLRVSIPQGLTKTSRAAEGDQSYTIQLPPTFFVSGLACQSPCDPEMYNGITFRTNAGISYENMRKAITLTDITDPKNEKVVKPKSPVGDFEGTPQGYGLDELGYSMTPAHTYAVRIDPSLKAEDGQVLGYTWMATIENWHNSAWVSFGDGFGVWETDGGSVLPFHARNIKSVQQWLAPMKIEDVLPAMQQFRTTGATVPPPNTKPTKRPLQLLPDKIRYYGFDLAPAIGTDSLGLAWAAVQAGDSIEHSYKTDENVRATLVQSTNLGISVKDSPQNSVILVTRLDDAKPVAGATVTIRGIDNKVFWTGATDANGIAVAPNTDLRRKKEAPKPDEYDSDWEALSELHFLVTAEKDGDVAYVASDWNDGIQPWDFGTRFDVGEANPILRGTIFSDRGVYKLGEEIHFKAIVRADTPKGMKLLAAGEKIEVTLRDSHNRDLDKRTISVNAWSSAEWTFRVPAEAPLGTYYVMATGPGRGTINGNFLVAAYRRPEFRVDTTLLGATSLAGTKLDGHITGRYLSGGAMADRTVNWTFSKTRIEDGVPAKIEDRWPSDRWSFLGWDYESDTSEGSVTIEQKEQNLNAKGELAVSLPTQKDAGWPYSYQLEGVVSDITRQQIAGRASFRVDPAPWYIGVQTPPYFAEAPAGFDTNIIAAGLDGLATAGVPVTVELKRLQWTSVRQSEGEGFYDWESERKEVDAGSWTVTTKGEPVPLHVPLTEGGEYMLRATAKDKEGRSTTTRIWFYALGPGYTAWQRYDHNRIDLIPEKKNYKPGDTARIMIKSPWETATALLTTEREGVRTWKSFTLTSSQQTITVPITEDDIPNLYVSVLLVKGRTKKDPGKDGSDPGKPSFRLGYTELKVEDASKRLAVDVKADRDEFRPATKAKIEVNVHDQKSKGAPAEVTLWAVDYGVLSLTGYETPDVLDSIYLEKALQVANEDSREKIISRRVLTPKGASDGGGGGADAGPGTLRKDFRVLAFWLGSLTTDKNGRARTEITLPESLTTYRIMAVAADKQSRFGWAQNEIRINKPLMITQSWPRFMTVGDKAFFGGVVRNQSKQAGTAVVSITSLDPSIIAIAGEQKVDVKAGGTAEVRWDAIAKAVGNARIQLRVKMGREADGFEDVIPVRIFVTPETVAAYGEAKPRAEETLELPKEVVPGFGGLRLELSSTAMVGLSEGASYLIEYPYGCAEQRSSRALALMLASDLGEAFSLPGIDAGKGKSITQAQLNELRTFQCGDGGFSYWPGHCDQTSPYLTSYVLHVFQRGRQLGYTVDEAMLTSGYEYLERYLGQPRPTNEGWMSSYTAWQAFAIKVLAEGGRNVDSHITRVYEYRDRMPVFGIAHLLDALIAKKENGPRRDELRRRILNSILPEGGNAFVNELKDPYLLWFWSSNERSTAIALGTLVRNGQDEAIVKRMVRWLMNVRKDGRWGNTQENAWAMAALVDYYKKYESEVPDFTAVVTLGAEAIANAPFKGRSTDAKVQEFSMAQVLAKGTPGQKLPIVFNRDGAAGTLFYMLRLRYASAATHLDAMDQGFRVDRSYAVQGADTAQTTFKAGDLIEVTLRIRNTKERRYVAVTDPIPAGTEPVESWFATTAAALRQDINAQQGETAWWEIWERGGFDYVERHDDRVNVFATRLGEGTAVFRYLVRATTAGTFITAPTHVEEMYEPEVFGRTATAVVEVKK
ncbi:MAG: alpha-2-macroglobulin, partial [Acidobacteriota bacterium]|nr:alpha-2-macroglobulin [Acidobacteriota bacterium]